MKAKPVSPSGFSVEKNSFTAQCAVILLICACVYRLIGSVNRVSDSGFVIWQLILPLLACALMALCILVLGKKLFWLSFLPVIMGVLFFVIRAFACGSTLRTVISVAVCLAAAVVYACSVFGLISVKWPLLLTFGLPFLYDVIFRDLPRLRDTVDPPAFADGMLEMSALCMLLAMLFTVPAMNKTVRNIEDMELPGIRAPKVTLPEQHATDAESAPEEHEA